MKQSMKKLVCIFLAAALLLTLAACSGASEEAPENASASASLDVGKSLTTDSIKIAYVAADLGTENNQKWDQGCREALSGYGDRVTYTSWDCKSDASTQNQIIEELIAQEYDGIFLHAVDGSAVAASVKKAEEAGVNVVTINLNVDTTYTAHIGAPNYDSGVTMGRKLAEMMGGKGGMVMIGPPVAFAEVIQTDDAIIDTLEAEYPDITMYEEVSGDWSTESGNQIMRDFITKYGADKINCVWCCNDGMALGALQALEAAGMKNVIVTGTDGSDAALESIANGGMTLTMLTESVVNAKIGCCILMEAIATGVRGCDLAETPQMMLEMTAVTAENVSNYYHP